MGDFRPAQSTTAQIDSWLQSGGIVLAASDRASRALAAAIHRLRLDEGRAAWSTPAIYDYRSFVHSAWKARCRDGRLLLNPAQEEAIWAAIVTGNVATELGAPQHRIGRLAKSAHELLCQYAPSFLKSSTRSAWQQDAALFSAWVAEFDNLCDRQSLVPSSRIALELPAMLEAETIARPALLLVGFDRLLTTQRRILDAWGEWREAAPAASADAVHFYAARTQKEELEACAIWCQQQRNEDPARRILVLTRDASFNTFRGQLERTFAQHLEDSTAPLFEFSLGVPLARTPLVRSATMALRWLNGQPLKEPELDWLVASGFLAASATESSALLASLHLIRRRNQQQPEWTLRGLLDHPATALPESWRERILAALEKLNQSARRAQTPLEWAEFLPSLLEAVGWPGHTPLSSADYQLQNSWEQAVENAGSLGFDGRRISLRGFLDNLQRILEESLYAPESRHAPIQIAGPAESAGLSADAIWFLGVEEDNWPSNGPAHPFLPLGVQRDAGMPHASAQLDAEILTTVTERILHSAPEVNFSFALQRKDADARPSRILLQLAGEPQMLPATLLAGAATPAQTIPYYDSTVTAYTQPTVSGGASVLTAQSQCPFRAFATARLDARGWDAAEAGLTAPQRGQILHTVLHSVWSGPPDGLSSLDDLLKRSDLRDFAARHVEIALKKELSRELRARLPQRYLELEAERLTRLTTDWLEYESNRVPFTIEGLEIARTIQLGALTISLRLDRLDRLNDGSVLVIDYKTGDVKPAAWETPRPADVQLPLYAGFALEREKEPLGGLAFAKIRAGESAFAGRIADAKSTLLPTLNGTTALVKTPLTLEQLDEWRECIEQLAADFVAGVAKVDPREAAKTCERCDLQSLCRIAESAAWNWEEEEEETND